jgi:hypothetical protein
MFLIKLVVNNELQIRKYNYTNGETVPEFSRSKLEKFWIKNEVKQYKCKAPFPSFFTGTKVRLKNGVFTKKYVYAKKK